MKPLLPSQSVAALKTNLQAVYEQSRVTCIADTGVREIANVTCPATSGAAQGDFILVTNVAGTVYAVWLDIDANGTEPNGAIYTAANTKIEVDIVTGDTAAQVAGKVFTAVDGNITNVTVTNQGSGVLRFSQDKIGAVANVAVYDETEGGTSGFTLGSITAGANSNLQNTYFQLKNGAASDFFVWMNVGAEGSEPGGTGTAIEVTVSPSDTAAAVALAVATAINANGNFSAYRENSTDAYLRIVADDAAANVTDTVDVDTGFSFSTTLQGQAQTFGPSTSPSSISVTPSLIS